MPYRRPLVALLIATLAACNAAPTREDAPPPADRPGSSLAFTEVSEAAGLGGFVHRTGAAGEKWFPEAMGSGGGFLDYDGDGWLDVVLVGGGDWKTPAPGNALWLYRNNGDGTFTLATDEAGLGDVDAYGFGVVAADYDNDGDADLFFTTLGENLLFRNDGGRFTEVGRAAGVAGEAAWSSSALFFDADRDGHADLYVGNYVEWTPATDLWCSFDGEQKGYCTPEAYTGVPSRFYHNNGDGTFTDWTERAGFLPAGGKTLGVVELDVNRDGWPDLAVANDTQPDYLYINLGDGTFDERGALAGTAYDENGHARAGMGIDAGVVDATGEETIFVGNFSKEMIGVYRHVGNELFVDRAAASRIGRPSLLTLTFGLFLFDADLDGDLDVYAANGHVQPEVETTHEGIGYREPPHLFVNAGDGTFHDAAPAAGGALAVPVVARGAAYGDVDRDGDPDVLITENSGQAYLLRNDTQGGTPLRVQLEGVDGTRDALGADVRAYIDGRPQYRRVRTGSSFLSQHERTLTFGLGSAPAVDSLVVRWPSGRVETLHSVAGGQEVRIREGEGVVDRRPFAGAVARR